MSKNLAVCVLGNKKSGKSYTWNTLFGKTVKTGNDLRKLEFGNGEYVEVFLVSASAEEKRAYVGDLITVNRPRIVLCSIQYHEDALDTIDYFSKGDYSLFIQWLNPGYNDSEQWFDRLGLLPRLIVQESLVAVRNGQINANHRVREIRAFIYGWALDRNLLLCD